jgi:dipeptidyl aminopeptidase/acylaminoacyl peptidase
MEGGKMLKRAIVVLLLVLLLAACGTAVEREPMGTRSFGSQEASVEEVRFRSGRFHVVGDLRMPVGADPHPAIIMVHGDGAATRNGAVQFGPMIEIFLRNGYAVFSWDKPGSGESTGELDGGKKITERAQILADAIDVLVEHPQIDPDRIGLWGISQAGWVMPKALKSTDHVAFMIVVSGGAEDGFEQAGYMMARKVFGASGSEEQAALVETYGPQAYKAATYEEHLEAMEILIEIPSLMELMNLEIPGESEWEPRSHDEDGFYDPMEDIKHATFPILVFYGATDPIVDPVQGAEAYEAALKAAGNTNYRIVLFPNSAHVFTNSPEYQKTMETWLQHLSP